MTTSLTTIRLGGVPEHFNLPIHLAIENGAFEKAGIDLQWTTFKGGTGQMTKALREGEVDACILLTEGIIKDIIAGNPSKIISGYVNTPLIWGVHTGAKNDLQYHGQIYDRQYAISRFGSGSHLMAIVDATVNDRTLSKDQFTIIKDLDGALASLEALETDVFYWEKYTTKPYVDNGQLRRIGEFVTPWPCFVIAATDRIIEDQAEAIRTMLKVIHGSCWHFMSTDDMIPLVAERYGQKLKDAESWYHSTEWATHGWVSNKMLRSVIKNLKIAEIINGDHDPDDLIWKK
jgi:ABC-type nitrate/sulfonate/bicarbonate transport system substrate-binding protein